MGLMKNKKIFGAIKNRKIINLLKITVSIFALVILVSLIDPKVLFRILPKFNLSYIPILVLIIFLNIFLFVFNYWGLLKRRIPLFSTFKDYAVCWAFSLFLPGKIGELGIIPVLKKKYGIPYKLAVISVVLPKIALVMVLIIALIVFGAGTGFGVSIESILLLTAIIAVVIFLLVFYKLLFRLFFPLIKPLLKYKIIGDVYANREEIAVMLHSKKVLLIVMIAIARFSFFVILTYISYTAFGYIPPIRGIIVACALSQVMVFIPITMNGLGSREAAFLGIMSLVQTPYELSIGVVAVGLVLNYVLGVGIILWWNLVHFLHKKK